MPVELADGSSWVLIELEEFFLGVGDLLAEVSEGNAFIKSEVTKLDVHLVVAPCYLRLALLTLLALLLLILLDGRTDEKLPARRAVVDNAGLSLRVVVTDEVAGKCKPVGGWVVFLDDHEMAFGEGVGEYGIKVGMSEDATL